MNLLIIRHAIAEDKDEWAETGRSDDERPLTDEGRRKMAQVAKGLRSVVDHIDVLATSPLVRARQTADVVAEEFDGAVLKTTDAMIPETPFEDTVRWLGEHSPKKVVAIVGHEPHLGALATWLLTGAEESHIEFKKGAACLIEFDGRAERAKGRLCWSLTPGQLRQLGR